MLKVGRVECGHVRQVVATQEHLSGQSYQPHLSSGPCQLWGARVLRWASRVRHQCWSHPLLASCFMWVIADFAEYCHLADKLAHSHKVTPQRQNSHQIFLPVKSLLCLLYKLPPPPSDAKLISLICMMLQNVDLRKCSGAIIALWVHWWEENLLRDWLHNSGVIRENKPSASAHQDRTYTTWCSLCPWLKMCSSCFQN